MSDSYVVAVDGLSALQALEGMPSEVLRAAQLAINKTADRTRAASARRMRDQVNFPASYLSGKDGRLAVSKRASSDDLEARITGRFRPTMLSRFMTSGTPGGKNGVRVEVAPGFAKRSRRMFVIRLPAGNADVDTKANLGIAIRLKPGERVESKRQMVQISKGLYLLFGPSVSQVFAGVADEEAPEAAEFLETEFLRLMEVDFG